MDCLHLVKRLKTQSKPNAAQFLLTCLLELLASWPCFYFIAVDLTVGLAIDKVVSMALEIAVGLTKYSL